MKVINYDATQEIIFEIENIFKKHDLNIIEQKFITNELLMVLNTFDRDNRDRALKLTKELIKIRKEDKNEAKDTGHN